MGRKNRKKQISKVKSKRKEKERKKMIGILLISMFLVPLLSLLILIFMTGCTFLAIIYEKSEKQQQKTINVMPKREKGGLK